MEEIGLLALLEARAGMESAVKDFLESARTLALQEEDTISWFAFQAGPTTFGIFDTFADEEGRSAHLNGDIAKTLLARAEELLGSPPQIQMVDIIARKSSKT